VSRPEIVEDVIAAAAAVPQALDRLSEEARAAWAGQLAADVAAERRASGVTVAPEAALHRALQARTDELERVRESARAESLMLRRRVSEMEDENEDNRRRRAQAVETMEHREAEREVIEAGLRQQIDTLTRERDEAQAALAEARAENASLRAVVPPGTHVARWDAYERVLLAEISPTPDGDAPTMTITATDPEDAARRVREYVSAYAPPTAPDVALPCAPAAGITVAPEAALHRALQARTDELERARAELAEARAENASLLAVVPPGTHVARVEWGVHAEVTRQRDEILRLTRERDEARAEIARWRTEVEARGTTVTVLRDVASSMLASITRFAEAAAAHDANADVFVDDEYHISTRALVEEFCREHGHPLAHEWATAKINAAPDGGAPTAPDVALPCAPAAGAADPLRLSGTSRPPATWWPASDCRGPRP